MRLGFYLPRQFRSPRSELVPAIDVPESECVAGRQAESA